MGNLAQSHRRLAALAELAVDDRLSQRKLAAKLQFSLGLVNALLRDLERGGLVKATQSDSQMRYAITRTGRAAMQKMSREFASDAATLLRKCLGPRAPIASLLKSARMEAKRVR